MKRALLCAAVLARTSFPSSCSASRLSIKTFRSIRTWPVMMRLPESSCVAFSRRIGRHSRPSFATKSFEVKEAQEGPRSRPAARVFKALFERRAAIALPEVRQETRQRIHKNQARDRGCQEILFQKVGRDWARCVACFSAMQWFSSRLDYRGVEGCGTDAAARDTADRKEIGAHATLRP